MTSVSPALTIGAGLIGGAIAAAVGWRLLAPLLRPAPKKKPAAKRKPAPKAKRSVRARAEAD